MIRWTGLAPWEFECPFPGSLTSAFLEKVADPLPEAVGHARPPRQEGIPTSAPVYRATSLIRNSAPLGGGRGDEVDPAPDLQARRRLGNRQLIDNSPPTIGGLSE